MHELCRMMGLTGKPGGMSASSVGYEHYCMVDDIGVMEELMLRECNHF